jgi:serine/threonine-protein kinase RsbT
MYAPVNVAVDITTEASLLAVRSSVREASVEAKLGIVAQTKMVTAASELARNVIRYAGRGRMTVDIVENSGRPGVRVVFIDEGPGIADIDSALRDGFSTSGGLGMGLPGAKRLADEFVLKSAPGQGTVVEIVGWAR